MSMTIETASRLPQGWAPWVGSPGLDPLALHTYPGSLLAVGPLAGPLKLIHGHLEGGRLGSAKKLKTPFF